ncbi:hypothetical protein Tco_0386006 [Tanacetum coccineum]
MLAPKCATYNGRSTFANPKYLKIAQSEKPRLYEIPYDTSDPANRFCPNGEETVTLKKESRSKLDKDKVKPYDYTYQNSLYETFKPPSKTYLDQLESAKQVRKTMWRKTFSRTKPNIAKNVSFLPVSKSISKSRQVYNEMTNNFNHFRTICKQTWSNHTNSAFPNPTAKSMEVLIKTLLMPLSDKTILDSHCFVHELKREMHDDLEYVKSLEKEIDELESEKADFSNIYDLLLEECVSKDVTCSYLHSLSDLNAYAELQCLYLHKVKECECLAQKLSKQTESVNKEVHNNLLKSFSKLEKHSISLELALQQCKENGSNVFQKEREQYHEIQDLKAQMQDKNIAISELKKLIENCKGKFCGCGNLKRAKKSAQLQKDNDNKDAKSHKTTKRYMPVEKSSASKKPERQIPTGHRWIPTGKLLNSCTGKVDSEPTHGSIVDIPHIHACKQTLGLSAELGESSSRNIDIRCASFQPQSHDYRWGQRSSIRTKFVEIQHAVNKTTDCTILICVCSRLNGSSIVEPKTLRMAMTVLHGSTAMQDELHRFDQTKSLGTHTSLFQSIDDGRENGIINGPLTGGGLCCSGQKGSLIQIIRKNLPIEEKQNCSAISFSRGRVRGGIRKLCSSNVDEDNSLKIMASTIITIPLYCDSQSAISYHDRYNILRTKAILTRIGYEDV